MDETLQYCQGCLSTDRILYSLKQLQSVIDRIRLNEMKAMNGGVCWECRSMMIRFSHFQLQVLKAQKILECREMLPDAKSFSRLTYKNNCIFNYKFYHKSDPLIDTKDKPEVKIKEEVISDDNCETETEIKYDDETIDDEYDNLIENDEKPKTNDVYVDILATKTKIRKGKVQKKFSTKLKDVNEEELKKFRTIVFTEEEMLRNREEKRNQPNFKKIPFKCDFCVLGFTRKDTYNMHMEKKHDENVGDHACPVCQTRFPNEKLVERHKKKHYVCYRCLLCKYETLELWSAVSHCRIKHDADSSERIHCPYCDTVAKSPEELSQHLTSEHSLHCNECGEKFKGPSSLRSHKRRIHSVKREFICDICNKTFKTKSRLESHTVSHNAALAQTLAYCVACKVQYKNIYVYRNHLKTSANHAQEAYQCRECNKKFASKVYWKKHYNFYHLRKSQFRCDHCNKLFISDWRLKNHQQKHHGLSRSRDHHCNVCGKQFFTLSTLKGHQLTHSEQRSFMCEDCGDTFKQRPALYTHCRLVHRRGARALQP